MATTKAKTPPGELYGMAREFTKALDAQDAHTADAMLSAWSESYQHVRAQYDQVLGKITAAQDAGLDPSPAWAMQKANLKAALGTTKLEINKYAQNATAEIVKAKQAHVMAGAKHAAKMAGAAAMEAGMEATFQAINTDNLVNAVAFLEDGTPLASLFTGLGDQALVDSRRIFTQGLTLGHGPAWIARQLDKALDIPRQRATLIARTESMRVYRETTSQSYMANNDVVGSWFWHAELDERTCSACMAMDGTEHPVGARLDGHPGCRCAMIPRTPSWEELLGTANAKGLKDTRPPIRNGQDWFNDQSAVVQRAILGPRKFSAWTQGQITLDDLVARPQNAKWGTMRRERSLDEILQGKNANWEDKVARERPRVILANPATVKALAKQPLDAIEAALKSRTLNTQDTVNHKAAQSLILARLAWKQGPRWLKPKPDADKVAAIVAKLEKVAMEKGYPSKAYSGTMSAYKAQANGKPGSSFGLVKNLSWKQKVTAQDALAKHDEWLVKFTAQEAEAQDLGESLLAQLEFGSYKTQATMTKAAQKLEAELDALPDGPAKTAGKAAMQAHLQAVKDAAADVKDAAKQAGPVWANSKHGYTLTIGKDGWGKLDTGAMDLTSANPLTIKQWMAKPEWEPAPVFSQTQVDSHIKWAMGPDGKPKPGWQAEMEDDLDLAKSEGMAELQANLEEALAQMKVLHPAPEADEVNNWLLGIEAAADPAKTLATLDKYMKGKAATPQDIANISEAVAQYKAKLASAPLKAATPTPAPSGIPGFGTGPDPTKLVSTGKVLGTHGATVYKMPGGGNYLVKGPKDVKDQFLVTLDEAASKLQQASGLKTPDTFIGTVGGKRQSIQVMFDAQDAFNGPIHVKDLKPKDLETVQKHQVLDWLMSNHDGHHGQFLRTKDGELVGIDKGQAFRWFGQDRLDWDFHPNAYYGTPEPVYNTMWREFAQGKSGDMLDPKHGALAKYIQDLKAIPDAELRELFRPYAEQAAARSRLAAPQQSFPGVIKPKVKANDVDAFLDALVERKNNLDKDFQKLYDKAAAARQKADPGWSPYKADAAKVKAQKDPKLASLVGKPKPTPPADLKPDPPKLEEHPDMLGWIDEAKARYAAFAPGKTLEASNNWPKFKAVQENGDMTALDYLKSRNYIDQAAYDDAVKTIKAHKLQVAAQEAAAVDAQKAYAATLQAWKDANGIVEKGGDYGLHEARIFDGKDGLAWAAGVWPVKGDPFWASHQNWLSAITSYTGSGYQPMNAALRSGSTSSSTKLLDQAFDAVPRTPEDIVVTRNMDLDGFASLTGGRLSGRHDVEAHLMGSDYQQDLGFMSASVNKVGAMSGTVRLFLRVPAGTKALYVSGDPGKPGTALSSVGTGEAELILARGTKYVVHSVTKVGNKWHVEAEVVPEEWHKKPTGWTPAERRMKQ